MPGCHRLSAALLAASTTVAPPALAQEPSAAAAQERRLAEQDGFRAGYASAILEREFGLRGVDVRVVGGRLVLDPAQLGDADPQAVGAALRQIPGLQVRIGSREEAEAAQAQAAGPQAPEIALQTGFLPNAALFEELIADPRWPRFSASLQYYGGDQELSTVFNGNFGATLPVYGGQLGSGLWQVGAQGGVSSIFDLESDSFDLINSDFYFGIPLSARFGDWSGQLRLFHQSSHLGDEFLLRSRTDRINLSFEGIDALLSVDLFNDALRLYGGGGVLIHTDPDLDPWAVHAGAEVTSPDPVFGEVLFPIAALDFQTNEESDWEKDFSVRTGFEIRAGVLEERRLQWLFEYFNGRSPNGQFFERDLEYFGTGLYFFF